MYKKCECGCGKMVKPGNRYINGHNKPTLGNPSKFKGKTYKEIYGEEKAKEIGKKISITKVGEKNPAKRLEVRNKISKNRKGKLTGESNPKYWKGKRNFGQSERMKTNNPLYKPEIQEKRRNYLIKKYEKNNNTFIGNNETELLDKVEKIINDKIIRQYKIKGYSADGYVKNRNLIIEIDERFHYDHNGNLREKDIKRQKIIENELNCKFLRIKDNIDFDELKNELLKIK